ncbi:MerR family transcriptional regulator [Streptomyces scopuliridis]|uniref:MerR family transcriptional regulator n=1 Tax=Streptomyces scopuliridis TaxID=452529 RepID=UPI0036B918FB
MSEQGLIFTMRSYVSNNSSCGGAAVSPRGVSPCVDSPVRRFESLSISELARRCRVSTRSLRYYEEQGLLAPARNAAGHRRYEAKDADCVSFIQRLYGAGLPSDLIRTVVQEWKLPDSAPRIEALLRTRHAELSLEAEELHAKLTGLEAVLNAVTGNS